jgi:peptide/nickel transport system substrate-binding protein
MYNFEAHPVILETIPSLIGGEVSLQSVEVMPGELIIDAFGKWVSLGDGVSYKPADCSDPSCILTYEGESQEPIQMDVIVVNFRLLPGILWSDGEPLKASDSIYAYHVFENLYRNAFPEVLRITKSYLALDELTVEWVGIPGYVGTIATKFFSPLPEHFWGGIGFDSLLTSDLSSRTPMGWGPYVIDDWVAGDHITLSRNLNYFRAPEGLPHFDHVVYRFMENGNEAIDALVIGECDFIDRTVLFDENIPRLRNEQADGKLSFSVQTGTAWELAAFGIDTLDEQRLDLFGPEEVRHALAMCIDRQKIVDELLFGVSIVPDTYVPSNNPLYDDEISKVEFDPGRAAELLDSVGWIDHDSNPQTPRTSLGIPEIPDGTPFEFTYLVPSDAERPEAAQIVKDGFTMCGIGVEVVIEDWDSLMRPGPDGPLFGRQFEMAQFAWSASFEPSCALFMGDEIPGPYPDYPKGWGGANLTGYSNPEYNDVCRQAMFSIPGSEIYLYAHNRAQEIFANDLPVIPLYQRLRLVAMRPDMCNLVIDPAANSALSHLELLDYGEMCK